MLSSPSEEGLSHQHANTAPLMLFFTTIAILVTISITRVQSGRSRRQAQAKDPCHVPGVPYWIPFLGNLPQIVVRINGLLNHLRDTSKEGIVSLKILGTTHNIVLSTELAARVFSIRPSAFNTDRVQRFFLTVFGAAKPRDKETYLQSGHELAGPLNMLLREPHLGKMLDITCRNLESTLPQFISFSDRAIDQYSWEKRACINRIFDASGGLSIEASLLPLILDFVGRTAGPSVFGTDLFNNNPNILSDLFVFNDALFYIALNLPSWLPLRTVSAGYAARQRAVVALRYQQIALDTVAGGEDPGEDWSNLDDVSEMIKARSKIYRERGISPDRRVELFILWALNANSNFAVFWLLLRILHTPDLLEDIRKETSAYIHVSTKKDAFGLTNSRFAINEQDLVASCPLLKAAFIESMRLDSAPWSFKRLEQDVTIPADAPHTNKPDVSSLSYLLKSGSFVGIPMGPHFSNPKFFENAAEYRPGRHIKPSTNTDTPTKSTAEWGTVRAFGGGSGICKGRLYAEREVLACVAGLLALWDFEPVESKGWRIPKSKKATGVNIPTEDVRVRIRRRDVALGTVEPKKSRLTARSSLHGTKQSQVPDHWKEVIGNLEK